MRIARPWFVPWHWFSAVLIVGTVSACSSVLGIDEAASIVDCLDDQDCESDETCDRGHCQAKADSADAATLCPESGCAAEAGMPTDGDPSVPDASEPNDPNDDDGDDDAAPGVSTSDDDIPPDDDSPPDDDHPFTDDAGTADACADCACEPGTFRSCEEAGLSGPCADGEQECGADGQWGACSIQPGTADTCEPSDDANCNGEANEGCPCAVGATRRCSEGGYLGACGEGEQTCADTGAWEPCSVAPMEVDGCSLDDDGNCDGVANSNCDCIAGDVRSCVEALGTCAQGTQTCDQSGVWGECSLQPAEADTCDPGNDDDCNGSANDGCPCEVGDVRDCAEAGIQGNCALGTQICDENGVWGACGITPASSDTCEPGDDANCNGTANEDCACADGDTRSCSESGALGACASGEQTCEDGAWDPCSIAAQAADTCVAGNDADCDGVANEGCACTPGATRACSQGGFFGKCAGGVQTCGAGGQWGACSITPSASDTCVSGNDDDCNGTPNQGCACENGDVQFCSQSGAQGVCASGTVTCAAGAWSACSISPSTETCDDGEDENCDGSIDEGCDDCTGDSVCIDEPTTGWIGPIALYEGTPSGVPSCPAPFSSEVFTLRKDPVQTPATCSTCNCNYNSSAWRCAVDWQTDSNGVCPGFNGTMLSGTLTDTSGCTDIGSLQPEHHFNNLRIQTTGTICGVASPQAPTVPTPTWSDSARGCAVPFPNSDGCDAEEVCSPVPMAPLNGKLCVYQEGDLSCPSVYSSKRVYYAGQIDTRTCSACSCGSAGGGCSLSVSAYEVAGCSNLMFQFDYSSFSGCQATPARYYQPSFVRTEQTCFPSGGSPTGTITPSEPTTICCTP